MAQCAARGGWIGGPDAGERVAFIGCAFLVFATAFAFAPIGVRRARDIGISPWLGIAPALLLAANVDLALSPRALGEAFDLANWPVHAPSRWIGAAGLLAALALARPRPLLPSGASRRATWLDKTAFGFILCAAGTGLCWAILRFILIFEMDGSTRSFGYSVFLWLRWTTPQFYFGGTDFPWMLAAAATSIAAALAMRRRAPRASLPA